jgi:hypothetical protein
MLTIDNACIIIVDTEFFFAEQMEMGDVVFVPVSRFIANLCTAMATSHAGSNKHSTKTG